MNIRRSPPLLFRAIDPCSLVASALHLYDHKGQIHPYIINDTHINSHIITMVTLKLPYKLEHRDKKYSTCYISKKMDFGNHRLHLGGDVVPHDTSIMRFEVVIDTTTKGNEELVVVLKVPRVCVAVVRSPSVVLWEVNILF